jgi:hypothetical protein
VSNRTVAPPRGLRRRNHSAVFQLLAAKVAFSAISLPNPSNAAADARIQIGAEA